MLRVDYICSMSKNMSFVYALSYNENVFYIGITCNLKRRYKTHINKYTGLPVSVYIQELITRGNVPIMKPLCYLPKAQAHIKESEIIRLFTKSGHKLLNDLHLYIPQWKYERLPQIINKSNMINYLEEFQNQYE